MSAKSRHSAALDRVEPLLLRLRALGSLEEKKRGHFYFKSRGFVHFHGSPTGVLADLRQLDDRAYRRLEVDALEEHDALIEQAKAVLAAWATGNKA